MLFLLATTLVCSLAEVVVLTGYNFDSVLRRQAPKEQTFFILFHKPTYRRCEVVDPIWKDLSNAVKDQGVTVAKIDARAATVTSALV
jgi:hypothetical protein